MASEDSPGLDGVQTPGFLVKKVINWEDDNSYAYTLPFLASGHSKKPVRLVLGSDPDVSGGGIRLYRHLDQCQLAYLGTHQEEAFQPSTELSQRNFTGI